MTKYTQLSRNVWLWTSGVCASTAGWAGAAGVGSGVAVFGFMSLLLLTAFLVLR
jgi:hypothetical protein